MEYKLSPIGIDLDFQKDSILPPGSITHPHQKGITMESGQSMVYLLIASKWFSNIHSQDYELFSKFCEGEIGKKIPNTKDIAPRIVKSIIKVMKDIENYHFNYNYMRLKYNYSRLDIKLILEKYFDKYYERDSEIGRKAIIAIVKTVLDAVFIFTVYMQAVKHLIPINNKYGGMTKNNLSPVFWKLDYVEENMFDRERFGRDGRGDGIVLSTMRREDYSLYCWWHLNDDVAKKWYHEPLPSSLWGNPPMGSILFTHNIHSKISNKPSYFFHLMLNTDTNPGNKKKLGERLSNHDQTFVDNWNFLTITLTPNIIDKLGVYYKSLSMNERLRGLQFLELSVGPLVRNQWFSSDPLWLNGLLGKEDMGFNQWKVINDSGMKTAKDEITKYMAGFVKMNNDYIKMEFINWPYQSPSI